MIPNSQLHVLMEERRRTVRESVDADEWSQRVELAACYRLIAHFRMTDWIYNHISARVPGTHHYLINPFGLLYEEITASSLVKVDAEGRLLEDVQLDVNPAAFVIHGAVHSAREDVGCVLHTHTQAGIAVATQAQGLLPISQHALKFYRRMAYHEFEGIALDLAEQARLVRDIGDLNAVILRNHGLLTMGGTVAQAFERMFFLERACQIQVSALAGNQALAIIPQEVCERTAQQYESAGSFIEGRDWQALLRLLDTTARGYRD